MTGTVEGETMVKVTMVGYQYKPIIYKAVKKINEDVEAFSFKFYNTYDVDEESVDLGSFVEDLSYSDIVLIDVRGGDTVSKLIVDTLKDSKGAVVVFVGGSSELMELTKLGSFSFKKFVSMRKNPHLKRFFGKGEMDYGKALRMRNIFKNLGKIPVGLFKHARNYSLLMEYYQNPSVENYYAMFLLLLKEYGKLKIDVEIPEPKVLPPMGIQNLDTKEIFENLNDYLKQYPKRDQSLIGILFYGGYHYDQSLPAAKLLAKKLESMGYGVIPVFSSDLRYYLAIEKFLFKDERPVIEALADLLWFRLAGGPIGGDHKLTLNVLRRLNVPILHGVHLSSKTVEEWLESGGGVPPIEIITTMILPELDGRNEPIVTHAPKRSLIEGVRLEEYAAIEDRVEKMARRLAKWVGLRKKPNNEKKIAIILYNYPPGEENLGKASYLNVFESLAGLLNAMGERGYDVSFSKDGKKLKDLLLSSGIVNSGEWGLKPEAMEKLPKASKADYEEWLQRVPENDVKRLLQNWGEPPGQIMSHGDSMLIPGLSLGKVFIGVQPSRGVHKDPSKIYHDRDLPPHHQYVAFYKWLKQVFKADAIIHFGTHGTLEFLPGKEAGLSEECFPDVLIDDLPNIYIYHAVNNSESSIAKRRSYAVIVNHASPPFTVSKAYGEFSEIEQLIRQYFDTAQYGEEGAHLMREKIMEKATKYDLGQTVEEIYDKINEYKRSLMPKGLHVLGSKLPPGEMVDYLTFLARYDRGRIKSLHRIIVEAQGLSHDEILTAPYKSAQSGKSYGEILSESEETVKEIVEQYIFKGESLEKCVEDLNLKLNIDEVRVALAYLKDVYRRILCSEEINAVLSTLDGNYISPGPGGDLIRSPEVFPTGRNMYQLDPTNIPTEIASERGVKIAEEYVEKFLKRHGRYPNVVSVVLWAFETMKTGGESLATIFRLLGVKPVWKSLYIRELEIIPLSELSRPRIDVVVTICGIFRDTFYNIVELLDRAFRIVADLDEPLEKNYVRMNVMKASKEHGEASTFRIFGPPEGRYATSLTSMIEASAWENETNLVQAYMESMKFAYGERGRSIESKDLLNFMLSHVDVVSQIRDTVEYEITDLDHYYEFLGGLTKSVERVKGDKPLILLADTTRERLKVEDASDAVKRGVITRIINPKWLDSMIEHGHIGSAKIADRVEYLLGIAATIGSVKDWMWSKVAQSTIFDKERMERIQRENPWALRKIMGRLLEANERGYWCATAEELQKLKQAYLQLEGLLEEITQ